MGKYVDTSRFTMKTMRVQRAFAIAAQKAILLTAQEVNDRSLKNLSGASIHPRVKGEDDQRIGKSPVPRRTSDLSKALTMTPLGIFQYAIWMDKRIAPHASYVHDGTKDMKARRYIGDVIRERRAALVNRIRYACLKAIRSEGR